MWNEYSRIGRRARCIEWVYACTGKRRCLGTNSMNTLLARQYFCREEDENKSRYPCGGYGRYLGRPASFHGNDWSYVRRGIGSLSSEWEGKNVRKEEECDLFGESVTFLHKNGGKNTQEERHKAIMALDDYMLGLVSAGKSCTDGGDSEGLSAQAAHSFALCWSELLSWARYWNEEGSDCSVPMLVVAGVAPLLIAGGVPYLSYVDALLSKASNTTTEAVQLLPLAQNTASLLHTDHLTHREQLYLTSLNHLLHSQHHSALLSLLTLLQHHPGDVLALSLSQHLSQTLGDTHLSLKSATAVASYWTERPSLLGYKLALSLVSLGLASSRTREAETLALSLRRYRRGDTDSGVTSFALAHVYDAEGRVDEGVSALFGFDGKQTFQSCGALFLDATLALYSASFLFERDGVSSKRSMLRIYDEYVGRILDYTDMANVNGWEQDIRLAPFKTSFFGKNSEESSTQDQRSFLSKLFSNNSTSREESPKKQKTSKTTSSSQTKQNTPLINVLSWLPPTPIILSQATILLLRLTLDNAILPHDERWIQLRYAWNHYIQEIYPHPENNPFQFCPVADMISQLFTPEPFLHHDSSNDLPRAFYLVGQILQLGHPPSDNAPTSTQWKQVVTHLSRSLHSLAPGYPIDIRSLLSQCLCHAALASQPDHPGSIDVARSVCSENVTLRPNSAEVWHRYSLILDALGDEEAAEDARRASVSLTSGGARVEGF